MRLIKAGRLILNVQRDVSLVLNKKEKANRTSLHHSLFHAVGTHSMTGCLQLLVPHFPTLIDYVLTLWAQLNPSSSYSVWGMWSEQQDKWLVQMSIIKTIGTYYLFCRLATWRTITWLGQLCGSTYGKGTAGLQFPTCYINHSSYTVQYPAHIERSWGWIN